tara:strand:- start:12632 stop:13951 length:1320 start_codon:yes stop_codon:yes gene_type:complete
MGNIFIKSGAFIIFIRVIGTLLTFVLSVVLARSLGVAGYGVYSFALSVLMILSIPIQSGIPTLAVREAAKAMARNQFPLIGLVLWWGNRLVLSYTLILCVLLAVFILVAGEWADTQRFHVVVIGFLSIPLVALNLMKTAIIRGSGRVVMGVIPDGLFRPVINLLLILGVILFVSDLKVSVFQAMLIYMLSAAATLFISFLMLKGLAKKYSIKSIKSSSISLEWRGSLYILTVVGGAQLLFGYLDTLILGFFREDAEVGLYRVAIQFSLIVSFGLTVLNQMLHPYFSRFTTSKDFGGLQQLAVNSSLVIFGVAAIPAIIFILFGGEILDAIYGEEYLAGLIALKVLVVGQLINAAFGSVGALLNMGGYEKDSMKGMLIAVGLNVLLDLILIPVFGIEGAAVASAISISTWNVILRYYVKKRLGIESSGLLYYLKSAYRGV